MYINMTPDKTNKTLHASQDDTNRQFKFKLVNDSQVLDTSDSIPPVIYDVEPNGIEQLLPVNSSTPTTSPIIADIQYPDELRENQEFFERIIPTTLKGQAKVKKIKGNTIVWNQLSGTGKENRVVNNTTCVANNDGSFTLSTNNETTTAISLYRIIPLINIPTGHKFYLKLQDTELSGLVLRPYTAAHAGVTEGTTTEAILTATNDINYIAFLFNIGTLINGTLTVKPICIDLTLMFGAGNEPTSVSDFTDLFPLPYYDYNAGSLLSFNGIGIKTTGKNLLSYSGENLPYNANGVSITRQNNIYKVVATNPSGYPFARISTINYLPKGTYTVLMLGAESSNTGIAWRLIDRNVSPVRTIVNSSLERAPFTINEDLYNVYFEITIDANRLSAGTWNVRFALEKGQQTDYEPYTENTIDLPISTYFPTGMKSVGTVYDELTSSKAITRIGSVDLGTLTWYAQATYGFYTTGLSSVIKSPVDNYTKANIICDIRETTTWADLVTSGTGTNYIAVSASYLGIADNSGMSAIQFKESLSGVYLYYELKTPTEEDIESCSLVSEDIEKTLEYDNGFLVCESDGLTSKSGFIPCKIKKVKGDETLYSQLINLHVERKP